MDMRTLADEYLAACEFGKRLSADTVKAYRIDLRQYLEFAGDAPGSRELLSRYIAHLNSAFAPRSAKRKLASVRAFYRALELDGILEDNPSTASAYASTRRTNCRGRYRGKRYMTSCRPHTAHTARAAGMCSGTSSCWSCCSAQG